MKKIILVVLMAVMIATPCFAQEVEPEGLFSVNGTLWGSCEIGFVSILPFVGIHCGVLCGFYQGTVYLCIDNQCTPLTYTSSYIDLGVVSIAYDITLPDEGNWMKDYWNFFLAIMQPIGIGVFTVITNNTDFYIPFFGYEIGIMYKINDNWTPPGIQQGS